MGQFRRAFARRSRSDRVALASKLKSLEQLLVDCRDFGKIDDYFHEQLVTDDAFMAAGQARDNPNLHEVVARSLEAAFGEQPIHQACFFELVEHRMWHGSVFWGDGGLAVVLFFEKSNLGLITAAESLTSQVANYLRFSVYRPAGETFPSSGPRGQT